MVAIVMVTLTGVLDVGFTVADGAKLHVTPVAGALHESVTAPEKLPSALTCAVTCPFSPGRRLTLLGEGAPRLKSTRFSVTFCVLGVGALAEFAETVSVY